MQANQNQKNFSEYVFEFQFDTFNVRNKGFSKKVHAVGTPYSNSVSKRWMFFICFRFGSCMLR